MINFLINIFIIFIIFLYYSYSTENNFLLIPCIFLITYSIAYLIMILTTRNLVWFNNNIKYCDLLKDLNLNKSITISNYSNIVPIIIIFIIGISISTFIYLNLSICILYLCTCIYFILEQKQKIFLDDENSIFYMGKQTLCKVIYDSYSNEIDDLPR